MTTELLVSFFHELFWFIMFLLLVDHIFLDGVFTKKITSTRKSTNKDSEEENELLKTKIQELEEKVEVLEEKNNRQENKINL